MTLERDLGTALRIRMSRVTTTDSEQRLIKAISHPLRWRILIKLNEGASSPSRVAAALGEPLPRVSYHFKTLLEHDAIELVETRPVRGALEHIYRATARPYFEDEHWSKLPLNVRQGFTDATLQQIWEHVVAASDDGTFDHDNSHVSWTALDLDQQGYEEITELLAQTLNRALEVHAESAGRLAEAGDGGASDRTELVILHYHRPREGR